MKHALNFGVSCAFVCLSGFFAAGCSSVKDDPLVLDMDSYVEKSMQIDAQKFSFRCYEGVSYVAKPADEKRQVMNIYVRDEYFEGKEVNGWTSETAPVFLPNQIGGYMPSECGVPEFNPERGANSILVALSQGLVVASPATRGRTELHGHAPACIVDLKAAVRYLRHNRKNLPGNMNRIISSGTSAGGAMSSLLGASGNSREYRTYLEELGAADEKDDIFAANAYCPILNLENADSAYEWFFDGVNDYSKMDITMIDYHVQRRFVKGTLTEEQKTVSSDLKKLFPACVNSLGLKDQFGNLLSLSEDGSGTFADYIKMLFLQSAQKACYAGEDFDSLDWVAMEDGSVTDIDMAGAIKYMGRQKLPGAFDSLDNDTGENNLFGDDEHPFKHFTAYAEEHSHVEAQRADSSLVHMMNPMNFVKNKGCCNLWRIRAGTRDSDTAPAVSAMFALALENVGKDVDYCMPWNVPHSGDYDLQELFDWIDSIAR